MGQAGVQEDRGPATVHVDETLDLVHRLRIADGGGQVDDDVDAPDELSDESGIANISHYELGPRVEVLGPLTSGTVDLRVQRVQHDHVMTPSEELVHERRADEPGASGHQAAHRPEWPCLVSRQPRVPPPPKAQTAHSGASV